VPEERASRRAAVVCRHPATLRPVTQALGVAGLGVRQVIAPGLLPRSQRGEFEAVLLDLDIDVNAQPFTLVESVSSHCPGTPVVCLSGITPKQRLIESLSHPAVAAIVPKLGSWLETNGAAIDGPDEQELGVALKRLSTRTPIPHGPAPYLLHGSAVDERLIASTSEKEEAVESVLGLGQRLGLSEEKLRRVEVAVDELLLNAIYDAPRSAEGLPRFGALTAEERTAPISLSAKEQIRLRYGSDARSLAISVNDKFGTLDRNEVVAHVGRVLEAGGPRPRAAGVSASGGAGLGLVLTFGAANQLIFHAVPGKFTEVTAVIHIAGSNRAALARGSALHLYL
jgi:hypothetical protein